MTNRYSFYSSFSIFLRFTVVFLLTGLINVGANADNYDFGVAGNDDEFLPVEEAFQVLIETADNETVLNWNLAPNYYLYQHQFKLEAYNGSQSETLELTFEPGKRKYDDYFAKELEVYYNSTIVRSLIPQMAAPYEIKVSSQGCADAGLCYSPRKQLFQVRVDGSVIELNNSQFTQATTNEHPVNQEKPPFLPLIILGALAGGLILNLMPCVFPVLSLKALSFASSNQSDHRQHLHGWAYTAGVVISFVTAAGIILTARHTGEMLGWGFQLQQPVFVAALAYLFLVMGLNLFGLFQFGTQFMGVGQSLTAGGGLRASFFTGVLAAVVASPCTAPFMATALGIALSQPVAVALIIFIALGFGMALPFLALSYSPKLAHHLPQPGAWMEVLKQVLAFPLLATCIWLLWVLGHQTGSDGTALVLCSALLICFALWLARFNREKAIQQWGLRALMVFCLLAAAHLTWNIRLFQGGSSHERWETYTPERLESLRADGEPVFINLTADWCITCKVNERIAFSSEDFYTKAKELGVTLLIGDWTNPNDDIAALLKQHKRSGIPLYLVFPARVGAEPEILPQLLTPASIRDALTRTTTEE